MKKLNLILSTLALCFALSGEAYAQRYLPGQKGLQITAGTVNGFKLNSQNSDFAFHAGIGFSVYTQNKNRWVFGGEYLEKRFEYKDFAIPQAQFSVESGYYLNFLSDKSKTFFFSIGASALAGYETINWDRKLLPDGARLENRDAFIYGGALTFETEIFLTDWLVLLVNLRERMLFGSSVGRFNTQFGAGIKFMLN
jgi:hypothetical protein